MQSALSPVRSFDAALSPGALDLVPGSVRSPGRKLGRLVWLRAVQLGCPCRRRARTTLEDFCLSYLPYHGLDPAQVQPGAGQLQPHTCDGVHSPRVQDFLKHLDVLVFVEALIYHLDEENEVLAAAGQLAPGHQAKGKHAARQHQRQRWQHQESRSPVAVTVPGVVSRAAVRNLGCEHGVQTQPHAGEAVLEAVLRQESLWTDAVAEQLSLVRALLPAVQRTLHSGHLPEWPAMGSRPACPSRCPSWCRAGAFGQRSAGCAPRCRQLPSGDTAWASQRRTPWQPAPTRALTIECAREACAARLLSRHCVVALCRLPSIGLQ